MKYIEGGRIKIEDKDLLKVKNKKNENKPVLQNGTIVFCRGNNGTGSFIGIVYDNTKILELENGSDAYINSRDYLHLGDTISYWTIEKVLKTRLVIDEIIDRYREEK